MSTINATVTNKPSEPYLDDDMERILEPPKKWRNKYEVVKAFFNDTIKEHWGVGTTFYHKWVYPSKEIAEQKYLDWITKNSPLDDAIRKGNAKYLGPQPLE